MVNVMGDALATGIMAHICRKDFVKEGEQVMNTHPHTHTKINSVQSCPLQLHYLRGISMFVRLVFRVF